MSDKPHPILPFVTNLLFPGGRAFLADQVLHVHRSLLAASETLAPLLRPVHAAGRLIDLQPKDDAASAQLALLAGSWRQDAAGSPMTLADYVARHHLATDHAHAERVFVETIYVPLFGEGALSRLRHQVAFRRRASRLDKQQGRIDFAVEGSFDRVAIEVDGYATHGEDQVGRDRHSDELDRQNELTEQGWHVLRFSYQDIVEQPEAVRTRLRTVLGLYPGMPRPLQEHGLGDQQAAYLLGRWLRHVPVVQRQLLRWLEEGLWQASAGRPLRLCLTRSLGGAAPVAILDVVELLQNVAGLYGIGWQAPDLELIVCEADPELANLCRQALNAFFDLEPEMQWEEGPWTVETPRLACRWQCRIVPEMTPELGACDLILIPALDGDGPDVAALMGLRAALSPAGRLVVLEADPTVAKGRQVTMPPEEEPPFLEEPDEGFVSYFLQRFFQFPAFREGQWPLVRAVLQGESCLGILSTGAGKTVCFQLPAMLRPGVTIVVSPLTSLIRDQVDNLRRRGLDFAGFIVGGMEKADVDRELQRLYAGAYKLFYVSPERLQIRNFVTKLAGAIQDRRVSISHFVIDEAHCMSEWGHDFRISYLQLPDACQALAPQAPVVALTATASEFLQKDVLTMIRPIRPEVRLLPPPSIDRPELSFEVITVEKESTKRQALLKVLHDVVPQRFGRASLPDLWSDPHRPKAYAQAGMIFTPYSRYTGTNAGVADNNAFRAYDLAQWLKHRDLPADYYYSTAKAENDDAELESHKRQVQDAFKADRLPIVVATKGFGTGIDKPNIRFTVHTSFPAALEGYYQEAGRAGRDKQDAHSIILYTPRPRTCLDKMGQGTGPDCLNAKGICPHGLDQLCSFGVQARMVRLSYPGEIVELTDHLAAIRGHLAEALVRGGRVRLTAKGEIAFEDRTRWFLDFVLPALQRIGLIEGYSDALGAGKDARIEVKANPWEPARLLARAEATAGPAPAVLRQLVSRLQDRRPEDEPERQETERQLLTGLLAHAGGVDGSLAAEIAGCRLIWSGQTVAPWTTWTCFYQNPKKGDDRSDTDRLLYRLMKLGIVTTFFGEERPGRKVWHADVTAVGREALIEGLEKAITSFRTSADALDDVRKDIADSELLDLSWDPVEATATAMAIFLRHYYKHFFDQKMRMLENIDGYCRETACRKKAIANYFGSMEAVTESGHACGRCDVCGITQGRVTRQETVSSERQAEMAVGDHLLVEALAQHFVDNDLPVIVSWFESHRAMSRLQGLTARFLEGDPNHLTALVLHGAALAGLQNRRDAEAGFGRAFEQLRVQQHREGLEKLLAVIPPSWQLPYLDRIADILPAPVYRERRYAALIAAGQQEAADALMLEQLLGITVFWRQTAAQLTLGKES